MPFDEFFSSGHKEHFVADERYSREVLPEVQRVMGLGAEERMKYVCELKAKARRKELSMTERHVLNKLEFLGGVRHNARNRGWNVRRAAYYDKYGQAFFGGFNTGPRR